MPTFSPVVRNQRKDGLYQVYIMIVHNSKPAYLRTDKFVRQSDIVRNSIKDSYVMSCCYAMIQRFSTALNLVDYEDWTATQVRDYLAKIDRVTSFSAFCREHIRSLDSKGSLNNALVYKAALNSFEASVGSSDISFSDVTPGVLSDWIQSLWGKKRARTLYPTCLRAMFDRARLLASDGRSGIEVRRNPWIGIEIPQYRSTRKKAVSVEDCRAFFGAELPSDARWRQRALLGRDVAMLVMCLAGINTVDLFKLRKSDYYDGVLHYMRSKTSSRRSDAAYFEIRVPEVLAEVFGRNLASDESEYLFSFSELYRDAKIFNVSVNAGIKRVAAEAKLPGEYSAYTFRHSWATIAQNHCRATLAEIGFAMNHSDHAVTRGYIKIDFSPAWDLNERVVSLVFGQGGGEREAEVRIDRSLELGKDSMVYARAYCRGEMLAEVSDIGFDGIEAVIARLAERLPDTVPAGSAVQFRIKDIDGGSEAVYERTKGNGF